MTEEVPLLRHGAFQRTIYVLKADGPIYGKDVVVDDDIGTQISGLAAFLGLRIHQHCCKT